MKKLLLITLLVLSNTAFARLNFKTPTHVGQWTLNSTASQLNFITTKNASKTEIQSFKALEGKIDKGHVTLTVDLNSVDTGIEIRDERLKTLFFDVVKFPSASVTIDLRKSDLNHLTQGQTKVLKFDAELDIQGITQSMQVELQVVALGKNQLLVFSRQPIIIDLKNFKLLEGVNKLRDIANLKSINSAVPVTFSLLFSKL
ncbi:MAG: YceI family protein [Methyloprofundus sp.]|nr:YceI family protein [Methyloprofundus sp.]